ncbi:hypothetical protein N8H74_09900 [Pseudomonas sp. B2M1-30]|uniref:hypothetical protein n=1 Tax=Pseudomonas TaxID=286 RepID=UPI0021C67017|nr:MULTISPECIES: hypothetical protein [Pseudomonas]MCU0118565.1 hypothetical protein [Pseudomonas sp. B2M1-30]MCU7263167.1 hypothetical protein [Pseudomonas koreensis]
MEFLRFLAFVAAWGFMWRWVVKNRGSWNLFIGNLIGAVGGFIVGVVVLSITLSLFPSAHKTEQQQPERAVTSEARPAVTKVEPAPVLIPPSESAPAVASDNLPVFVASAAQNQPSPPDSALLPNFSKRLTASVSEKKVEETVGANFVALRKAIGSDPNGDKAILASVMCLPFIQGAMRFPAAAVVTPQAKTNSTRFKDQTYTISNTVTARNMLGDDELYRFDCSIQRLPANDSGYAEWRLLGLKLEKAGS